jgi:GNAT superfamily N-acetyltransferase
MTISAPELLTEEHEVSSFACGKAALDHWLKTRALANERRGFTVVMVVHERHRVVGFYGLAPTAAVPTTFPRALRTGQPPNPISCLLLGQLATDASYAGRGIGSGLLKHALTRAVEGARLVGGKALLVRAVDAQAGEFWRTHGFLRTVDDPLLLFRSMADVAASLAVVNL